MTNEALLAVAGAGKTETIVDRFANSKQRILYITYTTTGQDELKTRLDAAVPGVQHEVIGWYSFLIDHFLKPYISDFPGAESGYRGFNMNYRPERWHRGVRKQFDEEGRVGAQSLAYVAKVICEKNKKAPIRRLEMIYEQIVIDEVQDLVANDLVILEYLLKSTVAIFVVGDVRQTIFESSTSDTKYKKYRGAKKIGWFEEMEKRSLLSLEFSSVNKRCHNEIVRVSNYIFDPTYGFPDANGEDESEGEDFGLHHVSPEWIADYYAHFAPLTLRWSKAQEKQWATTLVFENLGMVKGRTVDHVLIFPTDKIRNFLSTGAHIASDEVAAKLYVGMTRARKSVGFVLPAEFTFGDKLNPNSFKTWGAGSAASASFEKSKLA